MKPPSSNPDAGVGKDIWIRVETRSHWDKTWSSGLQEAEPKFPSHSAGTQNTYVQWPARNLGRHLNLWTSWKDNTAFTLWNGQQLQEKHEASSCCSLFRRRLSVFSVWIEFQKKIQLDAHTWVHKRNQKHTCPQHLAGCQIWSVQTSEGPFCCSLCDKTFKV